MSRQPLNHASVFDKVLRTSLPDVAGYRAILPVVPLCYLLVKQNYSIDVGKPQGFAVCAFDNVLGIAVGMDIDLDAGGVVANRAVHSHISFSLFFCFIIRCLKK
jgi:hypothetical protein